MDPKKLAFRMAIAWAVLFTFNSLGTSVMVGLGNTNWVQLPMQAKFLLCVGIWINWSGTMGAYISRAAHYIERGLPPPTNGGKDTSFLTKAQAAATSQPMKTALLISLLLTGAMMGPLSLMQGCSSANRAAYVAETGTRVTVETAMGYYNELVKQGKISVAQESEVRDAYNKVRASMIALTDAGKVAAAASVTNGGAALQTGIDQLAGDYSQNKQDLFTLLRTLGVKL